MKRLFLYCALFLLFFPEIGAVHAVTASAATPANTTHPQVKTITTVLSYDVYAGGIHALDAGLAIRKTSGRYDVALTAETQGLLKNMADWSGKFTTGGVVRNGQLYPQQHRSASTWKDSTETKTFTYDGTERARDTKDDCGNPKISLQF